MNEIESAKQFRKQNQYHEWKDDNKSQLNTHMRRTHNLFAILLDLLNLHSITTAVFRTKKCCPMRFGIKTKLLIATITRFKSNTIPDELIFGRR